MEFGNQLWQIQIKYFIGEIMSITKTKKSKIPADKILNQSDYSVYAIKLLDDNVSKTEGFYKTISLVLLDKNWCAGEQAYPMTVAITYLNNRYRNHKYWKKVIKYLSQDTVVKLESVEFEIYIKEFATPKQDLLIDADTPFQVKKSYLLDDHMHNPLFSDFKNIDTIWAENTGNDDNVIDLDAYLKNRAVS